MKNEDGSSEAGTYTIFLGGRTLGDRLNVVFKDYVPFEEVVPTLAPVFAQFREARRPERVVRRILREGRARRLRMSDGE